MTNLFDNGPQASPQEETTVEGSYHDHLVGEGKKFKDVEALAKAKMESDAFIEQLKRELAGTRDELNTRVNMQDFLDQVKEANKTRSEILPQEEIDQVVTGNTLSDEDISAKVDAILNKKQQESIAQQNANFVRTELTKTFGPNFQQKVLARAQELGVDQSFLQSMAERSPKAFLELVGAPAPKGDPNMSIPPRGTAQPPSPLSHGTKGKAYYDKMRREQPALYWSPKVQMEEYRTALKMGEAFFNS